MIQTTSSKEESKVDKRKASKSGRHGSIDFELLQINDEDFEGEEARDRDI